MARLLCMYTERQLRGAHAGNDVIMNDSSKFLHKSEAMSFRCDAVFGHALSMSRGPFGIPATTSTQAAGGIVPGFSGSKLIVCLCEVIVTRTDMANTQ